MPPLLAAALIVFFEGLGFGVILPVLTKFAGTLGGGTDWAGVLFAISTLPRIVCGPLSGRLSDHIGRRWALAIVTVGTFTASLLWVYAGQEHTFLFSGLIWLLISRAVYGLCASQSVLSLAVASDVSTPAKRASAMGAVGAAFGVAFTIGPAIGGWFSSNYGAANIGWLSAASQFLSLGVIFVLLKETHPHHTPKDDVESVAYVPATKVLHLAARPLVQWLMIVTCLATIAYSIMLPTFTKLTELWYGWNEERTGYAFAVFGLVGAFVQGGMIRPTVKRIGEKATALTGCAILAAGLFLIALHPGIPGFWAATVLMALGVGFASPAITTLMSLAVGEQDQGAIHGLNYSATSLGRGSGYLIGGFAFAHLSAPTAFGANGAGGAYAIAAAAALLSLVMLAVSKAKSHHHAAPAAEVAAK
jgi:MFS family permease